jgi:hypothetical protein
MKSKYSDNTRVTKPYQHIISNGAADIFRMYKDGNGNETCYLNTKSFNCL